MRYQFHTYHLRPYTSNLILQCLTYLIYAEGICLRVLRCFTRGGEYASLLQSKFASTCTHLIALINYL